MPFYDYECDCGRAWEAYNAIADRNHEFCTCGKRARPLISIPYFTKSFTPYFDRALGTFIRSRSEKAAILKEKGLREIDPDEYRREYMGKSDPEPGIDSLGITVDDVERKLAEIRTREGRSIFDEGVPIEE